MLRRTCHTGHSRGLRTQPAARGVLERDFFLLAGRAEQAHEPHEISHLGCHHNGRELVRTVQHSGRQRDHINRPHVQLRDTKRSSKEGKACRGENMCVHVRERPVVGEEKGNKRKRRRKREGGIEILLQTERETKR